jgi:hypothetical protein
MSSPVRKTGGNIGRWGSNLVPISAQHSNPKPAPDHLEPPEAELWGAITSTYAIDDAAALELLDAALQARGRMRRCRAQIDKDGEAVKDRWGQTRAHPLLIAERGARDSFLKAMRLLNLDTSETDR